MRWFKHLTVSKRDEKLMSVQDEFGPWGYGIYWMILEEIAEKLDKKNDPAVTLSNKNWARLCGVSVKKMKNFFIFTSNLHLFDIKFNGNGTSIKCPNMMKYRDEYTLKSSRISGQTPDNDRPV